MHELSSLLWTERDLLETLLYRLEHERLLLSVGNSRWLTRVADEISSVHRKLQTVGLARLVESEAVAKEWGLPEDATLRQLCENAGDEVWGSILASHLDAMRTLIADIVSLRESNAQLIRAASRATQEALAELSPASPVYAGVGAAPGDRPAGRLLDREA